MHAHETYRCEGERRCRIRPDEPHGCTTFRRFFCDCFFRRARSSCAAVLTAEDAGRVFSSTASSSSSDGASSSLADGSLDRLVPFPARTKHATKKPLVLSSLGRQRMTDSARADRVSAVCYNLQLKGRTGIPTHLVGPSSSFPRGQDSLPRRQFPVTGRSEGLQHHSFVLFGMDRAGGVHNPLRGRDW